jgi:hypothetical protein
LFCAKTEMVNKSKMMLNAIFFAMIILIEHVVCLVASDETRNEKTRL